MTATRRPAPLPPGGLSPHLSLRQQVWVLAKWPLLEQFMAFCVGFVDTALAGRLPVEAVASTNAIGVAAYVTWLMGMFQGAIGVGALAIIARSVGGRHKRAANAAVGQAILIAVLWGCVIGVFFFLTARPIGASLGLSGRTLELCTMYLRLLALVAPFMAVMFVGSACLRGAGDFRSPFGVMVVVNSVNIAASVLLVAGPAPIGGHGLMGIAIGTMLAWVIGGGLMLRRLFGGRGGVQLHVHRLRPHPHTVRRIVRVGLPNFAENILFWVGNFLVLMIIGHLPGEANAMGSHIIAIRIEALSFLPGFAFGQAAATMVGQYLGAGDPATARRAIWVCWGYGAAVMTFLGLLFIVVPELFVWVMTDQRAFLDVAPGLVQVCGFAQIGFATAMVLAGAMRGAGDTRTTMMLNFLSTYGVRLPLAYLIGIVLGWGLFGVWIALSVELMIRGGLFLGRFLHGGWARIQV